jgi:hypothetical protein
MVGDSSYYAGILEAQKYLQQLQYQHWLQYELFTYQWWSLLVVLIIPWVIWWKLVDKSKIAIILNLGFFMMIIITVMDWLGITMQLWIYPVKLLPIMPVILPLNWGLLPVAHMLIFQYFPHWKYFLVVQIIASILLAFVGEPFAECFGIYIVLNWYHHWSLPIYVTNAIIGKWVIESVVYKIK